MTDTREIAGLQNLHETIAQPMGELAAPVPPEPNDPEAERAVLGAVLLGANLDNLVGLRPCHFYRETHGIIWATVLTLHGERKGVDILTVTDSLRRTGQLDHIGGRAVVDELAGAVPNLGNAAEYAAIVRRAAQWRRRLRAVQVMRDAVLARDDSAYRDAHGRAS